MVDETIFDLTQEAALNADDRFVVQQVSAATRATSATFALMGGLEIATSAPTTTDVTPAVGEFHWLDLSGITTASGVLPTSAQVGERVGFGVSVNAPATQGSELDLKTFDDSDKINGTDGNYNTTPWSLLMTAGEVVIFQCMDNTAGVHDWAVLVDGRIPAISKLDRTSNQTITTANTDTHVQLNNEIYNRGCVTDTSTNYQITVRRGNKYQITAKSNITTLVSGENMLTNVFINGTLAQRGGRHFPNASQAAYSIQEETLDLSAGDTVRNYVRMTGTSETLFGGTGGSNNINAALTIMEIL